MVWLFDYPTIDRKINENNQVLSSTAKTSKCEQLIQMWRCKTNWGKPTKAKKTQRFPWDMKMTSFGETLLTLFFFLSSIHRYSWIQYCPLLCLLWEKSTNNIPSYGYGSKYKKAYLQGLNSQIRNVGKYAYLLTTFLCPFHGDIWLLCFD